MQTFNLNNIFSSSALLRIAYLDKNNVIKNIIEAENKFDDPKYKTELCQKFQNTGKCPYGYKCRFAHGKEELITKAKGKNYKIRPCKTFSEKGYCPYGIRCNFQHNQKNFSKLNFSYYYLQLFLLKNYFDDKSEIFLHSIGSKLLNDRLPVFKSFSCNLFEEQKAENNSDGFEQSKDDLFSEHIERKNSQSTVSNTSYGEDKKCYNNINEIMPQDY